MANYPQLDDQVGVWKLKEVNDAVMGGYWRYTGARAIMGGGQGASAKLKEIQLLNVATLGNATDFGDLNNTNHAPGGVGNQTRMHMGGGSTPSLLSQIDTVNFAHIGNAADFGDLTVGRRNPTSNVNNSVRGVIIGGVGPGSPGVSNVMDYITMGTTGNATDFGDSTSARASCMGAASPTRGINAGGSAPSVSNLIEFITIATTGNATDFGDLTTTLDSPGALSSSTRAIFSGNETSPYKKNIDRITIASQGNAVDYGDLEEGNCQMAGLSNSVRGVFAGGHRSPGAKTNVIQFLNIATGGDTTDFGDLNTATGNTGHSTQSHGGLND